MSAGGKAWFLGRTRRRTAERLLAYAGDGSVTTADDSVNGESTFTYDSLNRLATMSSPYNPSGCYGLSWTYGSVGNRTAQSVTSGTCPSFIAAVNSNNQRIGSPYQYDAAGNMINEGASIYACDAAGRILAVGGGYAVYVYEAFGRRIEEAAAGDLYLYDLARRRIGAVSTSGLDENHRIYAGSRLLAVYLGGQASFYDSDQLGTDRVVTDLSGSVTETCTSLPGACPERSRRGDSDSCARGAAPVRFAGYDIDTGTGLDHAPARYYSPALGRFMSPDPLNHGVPRVGNQNSGVAATAAAPADRVPGLGTVAALSPPSGAVLRALSGHVPTAGTGCAGCGCPAGSPAKSSPPDPQSLDRYVYVSNNPETRTDPGGALELEQIPSDDPDTGVGGFGCDPTDLFCLIASILGSTSGGASNFSACRCALIFLDFSGIQFFGCGPYLCQCDDGETETTSIPPVHKFKCLFTLCPLVITAVKPWGVPITWGSVVGTFPGLCR